MAEPGWGENRTREQEAKRRLLNRWTMAACLVVAAGARFITGLVHGLMGRPKEPAVSALEAGLTALAFAGVAIVMGVKSWRMLDEVQRREALGWLGATGAAAIMARPLLLVAQPMLKLADPEAAAWYAAGGIGVLVALSRRWTRS